MDESRGMCGPSTSVLTQARGMSRLAGDGGTGRGGWEEFEHVLSG
jgi:hypothetical protein